MSLHEIKPANRPKGRRHVAQPPSAVVIEPRVGQPTPAERRHETADEKVARARAEIGELLGELAGLYCAGGESLHDLNEALGRLAGYQVIDTAARLRTVANRLLGRGPSV